jgi:hypothetical protein
MLIEIWSGSNWTLEFPTVTDIAYSPILLALNVYCLLTPSVDVSDRLSHNLTYFLTLDQDAQCNKKACVFWCTLDSRGEAKQDSMPRL